MRIAIDLDDTCSNFVREWVRRYNEKYDDNLNYLDVSEWDIEKFVKCTPEQMYEILDEPEFFLYPHPEKMARTIINRMKQSGHDVFIVTATYNPDVCKDKATWIKEHLGLEQRDIIYAIRKELISADVLIDDGSHNIRAFNGHTIVFDRPHNQDLSDWEYDIRVANWRQIELYFEDNGWL